MIGKHFQKNTIKNSMDKFCGIVGYLGETALVK